ncbi:hypothetical protein ACFPK5_39330 [Streptomyces beijiangensis]|uniref:hypothetical protein n=1 Tax=Streptomyces beijiangensis TaxID=163361 RepID=UPI00338A8AD6
MPTPEAHPEPAPWRGISRPVSDSPIYDSLERTWRQAGREVPRPASGEQASENENPWVRAAGPDPVPLHGAEASPPTPGRSAARPPRWVPASRP